MHSGDAAARATRGVEYHRRAGQNGVLVVLVYSLRNIAAMWRRTSRGYCVRSRLAQESGYSPKSVTAPSDADETSLAYFANVPLFA